MKNAKAHLPMQIILSNPKLIWQHSEHQINRDRQSFSFFNIFFESLGWRILSSPQKYACNFPRPLQKENGKHLCSLLIFNVAEFKSVNPIKALAVDEEVQVV